MSGQYKEKNCPKCGVKHRKRGLHCSASCAAMGRPVSEETKELHRQNTREYLQTPEGIANSRKTGDGTQIAADEFAVDIPDIMDLRDYDCLDGYDKAENW